MAWRFLVNVLLVVHLAFLAYVVFGGFVAWRWRWTIWTHLVAATWGLLIIVVGFECPLTALENWARGHAGQAPLTKGFISTYVTGVLYPARYVELMRVLAALVVVGSWIGFVLLWRRAGNRKRGLIAG